MHKYLRIVCKIESWPLPLEFGQKNGLNLGEDLSFGLYYSQIFCPPLSKILRTPLAATVAHHQQITFYILVTRQ